MPQLYFVSVTPATVTKVFQKGAPAIICASDRPVTFYIEYDKIELQYISVNYNSLSKLQ